MLLRLGFAVEKEFGEIPGQIEMVLFFRQSLELFLDESDVEFAASLVSEVYSDS